ncbi:hypothetical protein GO986_12390 [Deinococcus sp. HMF7620]|uniref:Uncharacterized protein n=1 Tax=Deinococcus arboris TaxID=2682977 RepID=A0A7C9M712_9DEIO|nr:MULTISPECIES: hypothetical protein [Deinococcus]MBZ9752181.1 hypothetical protein [Deinococcus betulae]MVN87565.1 hypothetical protein [Deinococcus arboris]
MTSTLTLLAPLMALRTLRNALADEMGRSLDLLADLVAAQRVKVNHPDRAFKHAVYTLSLEHVVVKTWIERLIQCQQQASSPVGALRGKVPFANNDAYLMRVRDAVYATVRLLTSEREEALGPVGSPRMTMSFRTRLARLTPADRLSPSVRELLVESYQVDPRSEEALDWLDSLGVMQVIDPQDAVVSSHDEASLIPMSLFQLAVREAQHFGLVDVYDPADPGHIMELAEHLERAYNPTLAFQLRAALQVSGTAHQARAYYLPHSDIRVAEEVAWHTSSHPGEYVGSTHLPWKSAMH